MISETFRPAPKYLTDLFNSGIPSASSDAELLDRFVSRRNERDGSAELAFAALLARHGPMVLRVCRAALSSRPEAEDAFSGHLNAGLGQNSLTGVISAQAIVLCQEVIGAMTKAKLLLTAVAAIAGMLLFSSVGFVVYAATHQTPPPPVGEAAQQSQSHAASAGTKQASRGPVATVTEAASTRGSVVIQAEILDPDGKRLPGAQVLLDLRYSRGVQEQLSIFESKTADDEGYFKHQAARERPGAKLAYLHVWAYQPGRAIAAESLSLGGDAPPPVIKLTLGQPAVRTITIKGPDDRPLAGVRVVPIKLRPIRVGNAARRLDLFTVPDVWADRLAVTTDAQGTGRLNDLPRALEPLSLRLSGPGLIPQAVVVDAPQDLNIAIKLGRQGRLVGFVRTQAGEPIVGAPVEIWVQGAGDLRRTVLNHHVTDDEIVSLGPEPLKTGPQGAFQTPLALPVGLNYRVSIRQPGFVPYDSDWVKLDGERATIPAIRLQPLQTLRGIVQDRQGRGIAGARVFTPVGGPSTVTDESGRFALGGIISGKAVILAEHADFWLQGLLADAPAGAMVRPFTLAHKTEGPGPIVKPLADPIPADEARALADRLLAPYLQGDAETGDDRARRNAINSLSEFDLDGALEIFGRQEAKASVFGYNATKISLAEKLAIKDPARAEAMVESIPKSLPDPRLRAGALVKVVGALPVAERARKEAILERVAASLGDDADRTTTATRVNELPSLAREWINLGNRERACLLLDEARRFYDSRRGGRGAPRVLFLTQMARLDPEQGLEQLRKLTSAERSGDVVDPALVVAVELATDHPAEAELLYQSGLH